MEGRASIPFGINSVRTKRLICGIFWCFVILASILVLITLLSDDAEAEHGLQITVAYPADKYMDPQTVPQSVNFTLEIQNPGTFTENVIVQVTFDLTQKPLDGWTVNPNNFTVNSLGPGATAYRDIIVSAPVGESFPSFAQLTITGWVQQNTSHVSRDNVVARVTPVYDASIVPSTDVIIADPGEVIDITIRMQNTGDIKDTLILEDVTSSPYDLWGLVSSVNNSLDLNPGDEVNITYQIFVDPDVTLAESPIPFDLSVYSQGEGGYVTTKQITVVINQIDDVRISTTQSEKTGDPKEVLVFNIRILNEGNSQDTFLLDHLGGELGVWEFSQITLQPQEGADVSYTVTIDPEHDTSDILISLTATSTNDPAVLETLDITIHVNPRYEVQLVVNGPIAKDIRGGENDTFILGIINKGTVTDAFDLVAVGFQQSWVVINPSDPTNTTVWIDAGQTVHVTILVSVPKGEDVALYDIIINVTSQNDSSATSEYTFFANVLATYDFLIYPADPYDKIEPGETASYTIFVENRGTGDDEYDFIITGYPPGWTVIITPDPIFVPAGETRSVTISVLPPNNIPSRAYEINLTARSIYDPSVESSIKLITEVEQVFGIQLSSPTPTKPVDIGSLVIYDIIVTNNGNGEDFFEFSKTGTFDYWATLYYNATEIGDIIHLTIPAGQSVSFEVRISIPSRAEWEAAGSFASFVITVEGFSLKDPLANPASGSESLTTDVNPIYGAGISTTSDTRAGVPGDTGSFSLTLKNDGTTTDSFIVEIEQYYTLIPGISMGIWDTVNPDPLDPSSPIGPMGAGLSQVVSMDVLIPSPFDLSEVPPGIYHIVVRVTSQGDPSVWTNHTFSVNVRQLYSAWISDSVPSQSADAGGIAEYQLQVRNSGNQRDTVTFEIIDDPSVSGSAFWGGIYLGGAQIYNVTLDASDSIFVTLRVTVPDRQNLPTPFPLKADLVVKVLPSDPGANGAVEDEIIVRTNINPIYTFDLISFSPNDTREGDAGDSISFTLQVHNTGTAVDTYRFTVTGVDSDLFSVQSINDINDLGVDEFSTALVNVHIYPDTPLGSYTIDITCESDNDPSTIHTITLTIDVIGPIFDFELEVLTAEKSGEPDEVVEYTLQVRNIGTARDSYIFQVESVNSSLFTVPNPTMIVNLKAKEYGSTVAYVTITNDMVKAKAGFYTIEISAVSEKDPSLRISATLTIKITYKPDVDITPSSQSASAEPGDVVDYYVSIVNGGNAKDTFALTLGGIYKDWGKILNRNDTEIESVFLYEKGSTQGPDFSEIIVRVGIPSLGKTTAGTSYAITINAASRSVLGIEDTAQVTIAVEDYVELELEYTESQPASKDYDPNKESPVFNLKVTNYGNQDEDSIEIRVDDIDAHWGFSPTIVVDSLEPGASTTFSVKFTIPSDEAVDQYDLKVYVVSSIDPTVHSNQIDITINITKPDLWVADVRGLDDLDLIKGKVGNAVTISALIENLGETEAFDVEVKFFEETEIRGTKIISSIAPGESKTVDFRWTVVSEKVELKIEVTPQIEIYVGNNDYPPIYLDLRPEIRFYDDELAFSDSNPKPGDEIIISAFIENSGGNSEDVLVRFYDGYKIIGTDTIDVDFDEVGEALLEWEVPNRPGEVIEIRVEINDQTGHGPETAETIEIAEVSPELSATQLLSLLLVVLILSCIISFYLGYRIGKTESPYEPEDDFEEEYGEYWEKPPVTALVVPPPPPPPPDLRTPKIESFKDQKDENTRWESEKKEAHTIGQGSEIEDETELPVERQGPVGEETHPPETEDEPKAEEPRVDREPEVRDPAQEESQDEGDEEPKAGDHADKGPEDDKPAKDG